MAKAIRWILLILTLAATPGMAAKVIKIDAEKKVLTIDEGTESNFQKRSKICFYDGSNVKVGCGFIRTAKAKFSFIKIKNEKIFAKISEGMTAKLEAGPSQGAPGITADKEPAPSAPGEKAPSYVTLVLALPLVGPISYQNLIYETPQGTQVNSMWSSDSAIKTVGLGLELGLGIRSFQLAAGLRSRLFFPKKIASDYADTNNDGFFEQYVDTTAKGSSFGVWLDFYYLIFDFGVVDFRLGNGLDFDSSTVNFEAKKKSDDDDNETILYQAKSSLTALSLRILPMLDFVFGPVSFTLGAVIYVPLTQSNKLTIGTMDDGFTTQFLNPGTTPEQDLTKALKHKAQPGAELMLTSGFVF